jgi:MFS family permease
MTNPVEFDHPSGSTHRWRVIGATFVTYLYDSYDLAILAVVMPTLLVTLNINLTQGGFLSSATMIGAALGSILFGLIAENYGRKRALIMALVWFGLGTAAIYLVSTFTGWLILRFVTGIAIGGVWGPCVALLGRHWAPKYMARASAFMLSTFALGWILASVLGRFVLAIDGRLLFLFGATSIIAAVYVWFAVPSDNVARPAAAGSAGQDRVTLGELFAPQNRRNAILATLQNVCQMGGFWGVGAWIPTFLVKERGLDQTQMTSFLMLMYTGMFIGYQLFGNLADRIGRRRTIMICFAINCLTIPMYLLAQNLTFLFWWGPVMGMAFGGVFGVAGAFYAELFPERIRALGSGFAFNVGRLGAVIAPFTVGLIGQNFGLAWGIATSPIVFALGLLVTLALPETLNRMTDTRTSEPDKPPALV